MEAFRLLTGKQTTRASMLLSLADGRKAIWRTTDEAQKRLALLADPYLRERASDYQELRRRLLAALQGKRHRACRRSTASSHCPSLGPAGYWKWLPSALPGWCLKKAAPRPCDHRCRAQGIQPRQVRTPANASRRAADFDADNVSWQWTWPSVREAFQASIETRHQLSAMQVDPSCLRRLWTGG